ncbi:hypothetical protein ACM01_37585 [Streptomyces viridochromogenes]|uniref:Uncharacterized protein n=1 Tax=Streptomyces viridochromogenes TaxID=1938 RepID=A0A0J8BT92_STRVR|nr:hypothetical protein [Streptomyces viridochromogenes]KMS68815.1 hypothetical protein ACM01_37585 [Streptomyces viridochromogenes]KOG10063.1 hypothetical protein ADK35_38855 [Streptomyces viridochromogenes]KOG18175.1 hypothetical protein ADK36_23425 [Streptomyces viridochromogenes]
MSRPSQRDNRKPAAPSPLSIIGSGFLATTGLGATVTVAPADQPDRSAAETGHTVSAQGDHG